MKKKNTPAEEVLQPTAPVETEAAAPAETTPKKAKKDRRRLHYGAVATAVTVVVVIAAVVLNVLVGVLNDRYPLNLDLTSTQMLTLSEKSETFAKGIEEDVEIHIFYDETVFTAPNTGTKELDDLLLQFNSALQQYRSLSDGKVTYDFINLTSDPTAAAQYAKYEVQMGHILFLSGERHAIATLDDLYTYDETYYYYGQMVLQTSEVEQVLAVNINKVLGSNLKPITMLTGHGESNTALKTILGQVGYEILEKNITTAEKFNEETGTVIVCAPTSDYTAEELKTLREFLENGGNRGRQFIYIANYAAHCPNLEEYVADNYGVQVEHQMIIESSASRHPVVYAGSINGTYAPYGDLQTTEFTAAKDLGALAPLTLQLVAQWGSDTSTAQYVQPVVSFPKTAQLVALPAADAEDKTFGDPTDAESYPIHGVVLSTASAVYEGNTVKTKALISGSYYFFADETNRDTVLTLINGINGVTETIRMPSKSFSTEQASFGDDAMTVYILGLGVFAVGIPLIFAAIGIFVFVKRRNL